MPEEASVDLVSKVPEPWYVLPFKRRWPVLIGALAGLFLRLAFFGGAGDILAPMAGGFIFLAPFAVGAITVYVAWKEKPRSWKYCIVAPLFATVLMVLGSMIIMIEGLICAILIVPLFGMMEIFCGLAMGAVCRFTDKRKHVVYSVAVAPFLAATLTVAPSMAIDTPWRNEP